MAQRLSGYVRVPDEQYETVPWPVHALLHHLPKPQCAWDPCDRGDGLLIDTLLRCKINAIGTEHDFLLINEPQSKPTRLSAIRRMAKTAAANCSRLYRARIET